MLLLPVFRVSPPLDVVQQTRTHFMQLVLCYPVGARSRQASRNTKGAPQRPLRPLKECLGAPRLPEIPSDGSAKPQMSIVPLERSLLSNRNRAAGT